MNGGKVSWKPTARVANAATLTLPMTTFRVRHIAFSANHETGRVTIATVVTPDRAPVGL